MKCKELNNDADETRICHSLDDDGSFVILQTEKTELLDEHGGNLKHMEQMWSLDLDMKSTTQPNPRDSSGPGTR